MGGSGGSYFPKSGSDLQRLIRDSKDDADRQRLDGDINKLLRETLSSYERDPDKIEERLKEITDVLKDKADVEQLLFGGSVAKHTYVDGLSDVDALIILRQEDFADKFPEEVLKTFHRSLQDKLTYDKVKSVEKGKMAVTVIFRDGTEIQLLPSLRTGSKVLIPTAGAKEWKETSPKAFQKALTTANDRLNQSLIPTIKLIKSINSGFPEQKRLTGYHIESLTVDAVRGYRGTKTVKSLLTHILEQASKRVLSPIQDITGQSRIVDNYLGKAKSVECRIVADALTSVVRKLNAAKTVDEWKGLLEL